jgi:hypothetical protein
MNGIALLMGDHVRTGPEDDPALDAARPLATPAVVRERPALGG